MPTVARPAPRPAGPRPGPARPSPARPTRAGAGAPHDPPHPPRSDTLRLVAIGGGLGLALVIGVAILYAFGAARALAPVPLAIPGPGTGARGGGSAETTTMYRDLRDGRVLVMEIDRNGMRILGTRPKHEVPMAGDMYREPQRRSFEAPSANDRVNALGSAFR